MGVIDLAQDGTDGVRTDFHIEDGEGGSGTAGWTVGRQGLPDGAGAGWRELTTTITAGHIFPTPLALMSR